MKRGATTMDRGTFDETRVTSRATSLLDRLPPQNIQAEMASLGCVMYDENLLDDIAPILKPDDYYRDSHQEIFRVMLALRADGKRVDAISVAEELERRGRFVAVGGDDYLSAIFSSVPHAFDGKYYAQIVREKSISRQLIEVSNKILRDCYSNNFTAEELMRAAERSIFDLASGQISGGVKTIGEILDRVMETIDRRKRDSETEGIPSGWEDLDNFTGGFKAEQLIVIAARPSMGKSAAAWNIADHVAVQWQMPVLFVSLEMGEDSLGERSLAARGRVAGDRIRIGTTLSEEDVVKLGSAYGELRPAQIFIGESDTQTVLQIASHARRLKRQHGLGLIVIDYLQLVMPEDNRQSRQEQVAEISRRLKMLARELKIPVIALSQLNRAVEGRDDHRPRMSDLRESGAIENDADVVLLLYRPDYYDKADRPGEAALIVGKNRNGATGTVWLKFHDQYTRFDSLSREQRPGDGVPDFGHAPPDRAY